MAEVPEHLLKRSAERRKALGLPVPGEEGGDAPAAEAPAPDAPADEAAAPAAEVPAAAAAAGAGAGAATATATIAPPATGVTGPGGHTQRLLTVVKSGSIQQTKA